MLLRNQNSCVTGPVQKRLFQPRFAETPLKASPKEAGPDETIGERGIILGVP